MMPTDPRTTHHLISARQDAIAETFRASQHPSRLRVATGIALIRLGERLRGYTMPLPDQMPSMTVTRLRPARTAS